MTTSNSQGRCRPDGYALGFDAVRLQRGAAWEEPWMRSALRPTRPGP